MIDFLLGAFVMGALVVLLCVAIVRHEKKNFRLTPPETLEFFIPNISLKIKSGDTVVTKRTEYIVEKLYNDSIFLRRKEQA